jgi:hypothetical protein
VDLYLSTDSSVVQGVKEWFRIPDCANPVQFGDQAGNSRLSNSPTWLWKGRGQLLILSSPYLKGKHYATSEKQLLGVVEDLERLHNIGYVHGDIRAFNIIFGHNGGCLIDFDIGGLDKESTKYPEGYNSALNDGLRMVNEGHRIRKYHDWRALLHVLFVLHQVDPPKYGTASEEISLEETEQEELQRLREQNRRLHTRALLLEEKSYILSRFAKDEDPSTEEICRLKKFLGDINGWAITLSVDFEKDLAGLRLLNTDSSGRATSGIATGSFRNKPYVMVPIESPESEK